MKASKRFATVEEWDEDSDREREALDAFIARGRDALKELEVGAVRCIHYGLLAALREVNEGIRAGTVPESTRGKVLEDIDQVVAELESRQPVKKRWW